MSNSVQAHMTPSLYLVYLLFIKNRMILEQSNFVSAQTAQWELYFQCTFCDQLQLKESIFIYFWKPGSAHQRVVLTWQNSSD